MIIFNVTTIIEENIHQEFVHFMHHEYIPEVMKSNQFDDAKLFRLTEPVNEGITYCAQYYTNSQKNIETYREEYLPNFQTLLMQKFPNKVVFFSSILELSDK